MTGEAPTVRARALEARLVVSRGKRSCREACDRLSEGLDPRDRGLLLALVAGTERRRLTLDHLLSLHLRGRLETLPAETREALRLGAFQLVFCARIPPHAAVHDTVEALKARLPRGVSLTNAVLRSLAASIADRSPERTGEDPLSALGDGEGGACRFRTPVLPSGDPRAAALLSIRASLPPWLLERWRSRFGPEEAERIALETVRPPELVLRPRDGSAPVQMGHAGNPVDLPGWDEGAISVQDASSQAVVAEGVVPQTGEHILDLCAGVGGKACALAERGAKVLAVDLSAARLERLAESARRLGLSVETRKGDALSPPAEWCRAFDAVLLDAPCSNTGVLRRRPEARWRLKPEDPATLADLQLRLLRAAAACVKAGGRLVYATCSIETEENEDVLGRFLEEDAAFRLEAERFRAPDPQGDGGFWARLRRT